MNRPNWRLYIILSILFSVLTIVSFFFENNRWFTILTGIGCGGIASVIVAFLVDLANCRERKQKQAKLAAFALNNYRVAICNYLETFADLCIDADPSLSSNKLVFQSWLKTYVSKLKSGLSVRRPWIIDAIERVNDSFIALEQNMYLLVAGDIVDISEYKKMKMLYTVIRGSLLYYLIKDKEPNPDVILEDNMQVIAQMKVISSLSGLLTTSYSGNGDLSETENSVNEMDYLQ